MNLKTKGTMILVVLVAGIVVGCVGQDSTIYVTLGIGGVGGGTILQSTIDSKDPTWQKYSEDIYVRLHDDEEIIGDNQCGSGYIKITDYDITKTDYQVKVTGHAQISVGKTSDGTQCTLSGSPDIYMIAYGKNGQSITQIGSFDLTTSQGIHSFVIQESIETGR